MALATRRYATWGMVGLSLVPFATGFSHLGSMPFLDGPLVVLSVVACLALVTSSRACLQRAAQWRAMWAFAAFLVWALISSLASGRVFSSLFGNPANGWGWLALLSAGMVVLAAVSLRKSLVSALTEVAPWVVLAQVALVIWQKSDRSMWEAGSFSNPSYLVMALGVLLPLAERVPDGAGSKQRWLRRLVVAAGIWAAAISGGRAGFAAIVIWALFALWSGDEAAGLPKRLRRIAVAGAAALAVPLGMYAYRRGGVGLSEFIGDRGGRFLVSWSTVLDRPLLGWGPDGYVNGAARHITQSLLQSTHSEFGQFGADPHNVVSWVLVSTGLVGSVLFGWLCFEVGRNWRRQYRAGKLESAPVWAVVLFAFQALFAPTAMQTVPLVLLVLGASLAVERKPGALTEDGREPVPATAIIAAQVLVGGAILLLLAYGATRVSLKRASIQPNPARVERLAAVWSDPYLWYHADLAWGWAARRGDPTAAGRDIASIQRAAELEPGSPVYVTELARTKAYLAWPKPEVEEAFADAYRVFPLSPDARTAHAEYLLAAGDTAGAWKQLRVIADVESVEVWRVLTAYYLRTGNTERAKRYQEKLDGRGAAQRQ